MSYKTYRIKNEVDFQRLIADLKESNVPFCQKKLGDSALPVIGFNDSYGDITVPEEFDKEVLKFLIIEDIEFIQQFPINEKRITSKTLVIGLSIYAFIMTLLFIKYWNINHRNSVDKNFEFSWN